MRIETKQGRWHWDNWLELLVVDAYIRALKITAPLPNTQRTQITKENNYQFKNLHNE